MMKKLCLCIWAVLWFCSCGSPSAKENATNIDTAGYPFQLHDTNRWQVTPDRQNLKLVLNALKAYEAGDTARLHSYMAEDPVIYYDGGVFKGRCGEFMYAVKAKVGQLNDLKFRVTDHICQTRTDKKQQRVITWYTQTWINEHGQPDSADIVDDARLEEGKIVEWYDHVRRYRTAH